jgi:hypothetical protein
MNIVAVLALASVALVVGGVAGFTFGGARTSESSPWVDVSPSALVELTDWVTASRLPLEALVAPVRTAVRSELRYRHTELIRRTMQQHAPAGAPTDAVIVVGAVNKDA